MEYTDGIEQHYGVIIKKEGNGFFQVKRKDQKSNYYQANRDKELEKSNQYKIDNAEKIKERMVCECGKEILKITINQPFLSKA